MGFLLKCLQGLLQGTRYVSMKQVLLVHGMGRTPWSMALLAARLRKLGLRPFLFGYCATFESFDSICQRLIRQIRSHGNTPWVGVGHSLGGLLLRSAIGKVEPAFRPLGLMTLGTPHTSPRLARNLKSRWLFRLVNGDCGQMLADPARMEKIPVPDVPMRVVIGTLGLQGRWSPFGQDLNDGVVAVSEATIPGLPQETIHGIHSLLMNHPQIPNWTLELSRTNHAPILSSI